MVAGHKCGPEHEVSFFDELKAVFEKYPDAARNYAVRCKDHEKDIMRVDFTKQIGVARIEGDKVITEFHSRISAQANEKTLAEADLICCEWEWHELQHKWTCNSRWQTV